MSDTNDKININQYLPQVFSDDKEYSIFTSIIQDVSNEIRDLIKIFPEIVDIDNAQEMFLPKLSRLLNYKYNYKIDESDQREIIQRIIEVYKDRGTDESIVMAATYGDYEKWVGSHLFLPDADKTRKKAELEYPKDKLFTHDVSKYSELDRYPGEYWRDGVLILHVKHLNDKIKNAVSYVIPAGLYIRFVIENDFTSNIIVYGRWKLFYSHHINMTLISSDMKPNVLTYSDPKKGLLDRNNRWSGSEGTAFLLMASWKHHFPSDNRYFVSRSNNKKVSNDLDKRLATCKIDVVSYS